MDSWNVLSMMSSPPAHRARAALEALQAYEVVRDDPQATPEQKKAAWDVYWDLCEQEMREKKTR